MDSMQRSAAEKIVRIAMWGTLAAAAVIAPIAQSITIAAGTSAVLASEEPPPPPPPVEPDGTGWGG